MVHMTFFKILLLQATLYCCCCGFVHISDATMIANLDRNAGSFAELRGRVISDTQFTSISARGVASPFTSSTAAMIQDGRGEMTTERYAEYIRLFELLGLQNGVTRSGGSVWFHAEARSWSNGSVTKGYVYSPEELTPLVPDLDSFVPEPTPTAKGLGFTVFRMIKPHWYLYKISDG